MTRLIIKDYAIPYLICGHPYNITASGQKALHCFQNLVPIHFKTIVSTCTIALA